MLKTGFCAVGPVGSTAGAVQFDCIIEQQSAVDHSHIAIYARYWVSPDYFHSAVIWAEPHGRGLSFPVYPQTLFFSSDAETFKVGHGLFPIHNSSFKKPFAPQTAFTNMFGDYPIANIRFAEQQMAAARVHRDDLLDKQTASPGQSSKLIRHFESSKRTGLLDTLRILESNGNPSAEFKYNYTNNHGESVLRRLDVALGEGEVRLGLPGEGARIRVGTSTYMVKSIPTGYLTGGRTASVEYAQVKLRGQAVTVPALIQVRSLNKEYLLSARLTKVQEISMSPDEARLAAEQYGAFSSTERACRELIAKYWKQSPLPAESSDRSKIAQLEKELRSSMHPDDSLGKRLKHLNMFMELARVEGDDQKLENRYRDFLLTLRTNGQPEMMLVGGQTAIDTLMIWGRFKAADLLLNSWLEAVGPIRSPELIERFARRELIKGNYLTTSRILKDYLEQEHLSPKQRFPLAAMQVLALNGMLSLVDRKDEQQIDVAKAQAEWIASRCQRKDLSSAIQRSIEEADQSFRLIEKPNEEQVSMSSRINEIRSNISLK